MFDPISFTQELVRFDTTNPPGREAACAEFVADTLERAGFSIDKQSFENDRMNIIATLPGNDMSKKPLIFTGHLDTVPLGSAAWTYSPFDGEIVDGKLYGRGASDMKAGVSAMIGAALKFARSPQHLRKRGLKLIFTSGEETGCAGALHLVQHGRELLGDASGMIIGEPTENRVSTAHKGALFISAKCNGVTAHSSQPDLGENAIYKAARAISKIEDYGFNEEPHPLLGGPTINVGMITGGMNVNSVPDSAEFTIDIRTNAVKSHDYFFDALKNYLGADVALDTFTDMPAVSTSPDDPLTVLAVKACCDVLGDRSDTDPCGLPFFTDGSALTTHFQCPTLILGPGETSTMHQTDEYCLVSRIEEAMAIYSLIADRWCLSA